MAAAIPTMTSTEDGRLMPDPLATVAADVTQPYPLTYVDYAIAPLEKLVDEDCTALTASQSMLSTWLSYMVGDGQAVLPPGYGALTEELSSVASAAIEKVGSEYPACLEPPEPPVDPGSGNPIPVGTPIGSGPGSRRTVTTLPVTTDVAVTATSDEVAAAPEMPEFAPPPAANTAAALGGLLVVLGLLSIVVLSATGRMPSWQSIRARFGGVRS
jgi:hypothetical protein